jgi:hypothetical protein
MMAALPRSALSEGIIAITALMSMYEADSVEMTVQIDVSGHRLPLNILKPEMDQRASIARDPLSPIRDKRLAQTAACGVLHRLRQCRSRWFLVAHDNAGARTLE